MPTGEYYKGFREAVRLMQQAYSGDLGSGLMIEKIFEASRPPKKQMLRDLETGFGSFTPPKRRRKLSKWQKFVKDNAKKPRFKYKSGRKKGMINLKALGVAYRKKKR